MFLKLVILGFLGFFIATALSIKAPPYKTIYVEEDNGLYSLLMQASKINGRIWLTDTTLMDWTLDDYTISASRINVDEDYVEDFRKDLNISADDQWLSTFGVKETTLANGTYVRVQSKGIPIRKGAYHLKVDFFPSIEKIPNRNFYLTEQPWELHMVFNEESQCTDVNWLPSCFAGYWLKAYLRTTRGKTSPTNDMVFISSYVDNELTRPQCFYPADTEQQSTFIELPFLYGNRNVMTTAYNLRLMVFANLEKPEFPSGQSFNPCNWKRENIFKETLSALKVWYHRNAGIIFLIIITTVLGIALSKKLIRDQRRIRFLECAYSAQCQNDKDEKEPQPTANNGNQFENKAFSSA